MKLSYITLFIAAVALVGCKPADKSADSGTSPSAATTGATADNGSAPAASADDSKGSLVGTWTVDDPETNDGVAEFKDDGTLSITGQPKEMKNVDIAESATYKMEGDKMTKKVTDLKMTPTADADDKTKKDVEEDMKALTPDEIAKQDPEVDTIAWKGKDSFTVTNDKTKKAMTFTRKS
ncbi:MAG TPA: hypothetical protein VGL56_05410 [Fimbriimonadaceae bacterium]|jgi:uncharacterized protein (TIGR03066 family)